MHRTLSAVVVAAAVAAFAAPAFADCFTGHTAQSSSTITTASADQATTKPVQQTQAPTSK